ncbi:threonine-phosphate decarboxylase CobD [Paenibacillus mesotrionivorans]|uniref:Threonine-phosphate decarboxylase CobD n=1 Tax=Paenibacillus mesotrionivorans TaxID=3160968 RepID=A0ACC7NWZ7_9BACL
MMLEKHGHGGDVWTAAELYGLDKNSFLDFSSNMNPLGPPEAAGRIIQEEWRRELSRYPDPDCRELRQRIGEVYGVSASCVLAGNGAAEIIDLAVRSRSPRTVGLLQPSFREYATAAQRAGAGIVDIPLSAEREFDPVWSLAEVQKAAREAELFLFGHPNNPTGRLLPPEFVRQLTAAGKPVILDEAFIDFSGEEERVSFIRQAAESDRLCVVRSMTKFYTVPGLRLGFAVAGQGWIEAMKRLQVEWSVNGLAQRIGQAVLGDEEYARATRDWLHEESAWLTQALTGLGLRATPSAANYLLFRIPSEWGVTIHSLQEAMGRRGILIRSAATYQGLDDRYGRSAIRSHEDNMRLVAALAACLEDLRG